MSQQTSTRQLREGYSLVIVRTVGGIEHIGAVWESMNDHPNTDLRSFLSYLDQKSSSVEPLILVLFKDEAPVAMLVGRVETIRVRMRIGYLVVGPTARCLTVVYRGIMGDAAGDKGCMLLEELLCMAKRREVDVIFFNQLRVDTPFFKRVTTSPGLFYRDFRAPVSVHRTMVLPDHAIDIVGRLNSKHRYWIRRMSRALEERYPRGVRMKCFERASDVNELCSEAEAIAKTTYQRGLGVGFINDETTRRRLNMLAEHDRLRGYILYAGGEPCAFWIGTLYRDTFYLDFTGYAEDFGKYEVGTLLLIRMFEDLVARKVKRVDFGYGDALYKKRFADAWWHEASVYIFAPTYRGVIVKAVRLLSVICERLATGLLTKAGWAWWVKKRWRRKLADRQKKRI